MISGTVVSTPVPRFGIVTIMARNKPGAWEKAAGWGKEREWHPGWHQRLRRSNHLSKGSLLWISVRLFQYLEREKCFLIGDQIMDYQSQLWLTFESRDTLSHKETKHWNILFSRWWPALLLSVNNLLKSCNDKWLNWIHFQAEIEFFQQRDNIQDPAASLRGQCRHS